MLPRHELVYESVVVVVAESELTINSLSLSSSTRLTAVSCRTVRPVVSIKVRWMVISLATIGTEVSYLMFLGCRD